MVSVLGNYYESRPVIIEQASILLCSSGSIVLGLELTSGDLLFSFKGHKDIVTSIYFNEFQPNKVVSSSKDGVVLTWDLQTRRVIDSCKVGSSVHLVLFPEFTTNQHTGKPDMYLIMKSDKHVSDQSDAYKFVIYDAENAKIRRNICEIVRPSGAVCRANIAGTEIVLAASKRKLCIVVAESRVGYKTMCPANHSITCVVANSHRDIIVTGHSNGELLLWHDIRNWLAKETGKNALMAEAKTGDLIAIPPPTSTIMHWHAHAVTTISTNIDGSMIYSGGEEGVLVVWQTTTGKKAFVPHLGAGMAHITASHLYPLAAVTTNNNCLRVINTSSLLESWATSSLCVGPFLDHSIPSDRFSRSLLEIDPKSSLLACNGYPGQLQLYDITANSVKSIHEVVQYNRVSRTEKHTKIFVPSVPMFKFQSFHTSRTGTAKFLLATVDVRKGEEFVAEASLKFWSWSDAMNSYKLVTHVPRPHGAARVTSIAFSPSHPLYTCATAATDGSVKIWRLDPMVAAGKMFGDAHWSCVYSFTYRAAAAGALSFSSDGSVLAVSHANTVSLWDPVNLSLRASLVVPGPSNNVTFTAFVEPPGSCGAYFVAAGKSCMVAYDLLSMSLLWRLDGELSAFSAAVSSAEAIKPAAPSQVELTSKKSKKKKQRASSDLISEDSALPDLQTQGWLAVCRRVGSGDVVSEEEEGASKPSSEAASYELLVLSPLAAPTDPAGGAGGNEDGASLQRAAGPQVVCCSRLAAEATGTVFWSPGRAEPMRSGAGPDSPSKGSIGGNAVESAIEASCVLAATVTGELIVTNCVVAAQEASEEASRLVPKDGTSLGVSDNIYRKNETKAASLPAGISFKSKSSAKKAGPVAVAAGQVKDGWVGEFFDGVSGNVPPVASIYDDFMASLLKKSGQGGAQDSRGAAEGGAAMEVAAEQTDVDSDNEPPAKAAKKPAANGSFKSSFEQGNIASFSAAGAQQFSQLLGDSLKKASSKQNGHVSNGSDKKTPKKSGSEKPSVADSTPVSETKKKRGKRPVAEDTAAELAAVSESAPPKSAKKRKTAVA